jgi:hypothetical protein
MNFLFHGVNVHVHIFLHSALFITLKKFVLSLSVPRVKADQTFGRQQAITLFPGAVCLSPTFSIFSVCYTRTC